MRSAALAVAMAVVAVVGAGCWWGDDLGPWLEDTLDVSYLPYQDDAVGIITDAMVDEGWPDPGYVIVLWYRDQVCLPPHEGGCRIGRASSLLARVSGVCVVEVVILPWEYYSDTPLAHEIAHCVFCRADIEYCGANDHVEPADGWALVERINRVLLPEVGL